MDNSIMLFILFGAIPTCLFAFLYFDCRENQKRGAISQAEIEYDDNQSDIPIQIYQPEKKAKGRVWGTLGMLYMTGYAFYINDVISSANVTNLGEAIGKAAAVNVFSPFFYCVLASALLAFVGVVGKNKICVLLALAATIGAVCILPGAFEMLIIPAVLFVISYIRMAKGE